MFKIVRFLLKPKSFFNSLENRLRFKHFEYFQTHVLLGVIILQNGYVLCRVSGNLLK